LFINKKNCFLFVQRATPRPWLGADEIWTGIGIGDGLMLVYMLNVDSEFVLFVDFSMAVALGVWLACCFVFCWIFSDALCTKASSWARPRPPRHLGVWHWALCYGSGAWVFGVRFF
jgi:hypothetical protein